MQLIISLPEDLTCGLHENEPLCIQVVMHHPSEPSFKASLKADQRRQFYERNKPIAVVLIVVVFVAPILGVFLNGLAGLFWGMTVSVLGYYLTPYVVMKLREVLGGE